jgi:hypothetical protein
LCAPCVTINGAANYSDSGINHVRMTIPCEDLKHSFKLIFVRNFNLSVNTEVADYFFEHNGQVYKDVPRVWLDHLGLLAFAIVKGKDFLTACIQRRIRLTT